MTYWEIEPYHTDQADSFIAPGDTQEQHKAALEYAKDRLEEAWDQIEPGETKTITISLREGEMPECEIDPR